MMTKIVLPQVRMALLGQNPFRFEGPIRVFGICQKGSIKLIRKEVPADICYSFVVSLWRGDLRYCKGRAFNKPAAMGFEIVEIERDGLR